MSSKAQKRLTFEEHDQLDRERYADFLIQLAQNAESDKGSYTIAVNAPYGSGKTTLLKMMASKIDEVYSTMDKPLIAVEYNAWKYDYFDEPLMPLAVSLFKNEALEDESRYERATGKFIRASRFVASLSNGVLNHFTGVDFEHAAEKSKVSNETEERYFEYEKAIEDLCEALSEAVNEYGKEGKMIVIIDELDRCKPDFAIKTLEITKHLLSNENIVFLYALDMGQLQKTVEKAYGTGMDSAGYLLRFFNYITTIPEPRINEYVKRKIEDIEDQQYVENVSSELVRCCSDFHLTLRDIDRIVVTYKLMCDCFVNKYSNTIAHMLYLHLLCLKYKKREWFECVIGHTWSGTDEFSRFYGTKRDDDKGIRRRIKELTTGKQGRIEIVDKRALITGDLSYEPSNRSVRRQKISIYYYMNKVVTGSDLDSAVNGYGNEVKINTIIGQALFKEDIERFETIKASSILEYIHQQMEFFNFETGLDDSNSDALNSDVVLLDPPTPKKK